MRWILKEEVIKSIYADNDLYAAVAKSLDRKPMTLPALLRTNDPKLTQKAVLQIISKHLKIAEKDLLELVDTRDKKIAELG